MANLGICRKCQMCVVLSPAIVDGDDEKTRRTWVECSLVGTGLEWEDEVPADCPYVLEHKLTEGAVEDLDDELREGGKPGGGRG